MGSGQSKSEETVPNGNNNTTNVSTLKETANEKTVESVDQTSGPTKTTTTTTPAEIRSTGLESSNFTIKNKNELRQIQSTDEKTKEPEIKREQKVNPTSMKQSVYDDLSYDENSDSWMNVDIEKRQKKLKMKGRQKVNIKKVDDENFIEFLDTSDESDADSILGRGDSKRMKNKKVARTKTQSERVANAISLPLPAPATHPNHSKVFEEEKALNEYNLQHGYHLLPSPQKKSEIIHSVGLNNNETSQNKYPESYDQRLQRGNHRRDQDAIVIEKAIHRDSTDDLDLEESIVKTFDAERFKAANVKKADHCNTHDEKYNGLYKPDESRERARDSQFERKRSRGNNITPEYDDYDEDLMDAIEREFE